MLQDAVDDRLLDVRPQRSGRLGALGTRRARRAAAVAEPVLVGSSLCLDSALGFAVGGFDRGTGRGRRVEHVVDRHDDREVERLRRARRHDLDRRGAARGSGRPRRSGAPSPTGRCAGPAVSSERVEALEAHREVRAALGGRDRVDLVDDHGVDVLERLAGLAREHQVERLGRRDEDVGRRGDELAPVGGGRVARADADRHPGHRDAEPSRRLADADQGRAQVALHVDAERLQRRDVEDARGGRRLRCAAPAGWARLPRRGGRCGILLAEDPVDRPQERRERLARSGRGDHEGVLAVRDRIPRAELGGCGLGERAAEPVLRRRTEPLEHIAHPSIFPGGCDIGAGRERRVSGRTG